MSDKKLTKRQWQIIVGVNITALLVALFTNVVIQDYVHYWLSRTTSFNPFAIIALAITVTGSGWYVNKKI